MITIQVSTKSFDAQAVPAYIVPCEQGFTFESHPIALLTRFYAPLKTLVEQRGFTGALNSTCVIAGVDNNEPIYIILIGTGSAKTQHFDHLEYYRRAIANALRILESIKITHAALLLPDAASFSIDAYTLAMETVSILDIASYHFDQFITDATRRLSRDYDITLVCRDDQKAQVEEGAKIGLSLGYAVNEARLWGDLPPVVLTPTRLAEHAQRIAQTHNLGCSVFTEDQIIQMGMGGIHAVAKGSDQEARMIVMEYKSRHKNAPTIALVGKGITFDSGGLSLKPATAMETMKDDMAGAAAVIATMQLLPHLQPQVNVIGLAPITENLISGHATKPGDIIQFYNGKTAEVKNTDAEGRLILADALSYAVKHYKLDAIISIATLTGSCAAALGPFFAGLMSQHEALAHKIIAAGKASGDRVWELPLHNDFKPAIRSEVADISNIGSEKYKAGAITAAFFLQHFVGDVPWVHLDIAGTAFNVPDSYFRPGSTGFGVRLFAQLLKDW